MLKAFFEKHKVLFKPGLLAQEFVHVRYGKLYWLKYLSNKKFRLSEQKKRKALDDWSDEFDRMTIGKAFFPDLF